MSLLTLYCKSFRTDLNRVIRLVESANKHNKDKLPFYISVPSVDLKIFQDHLADLPVTLIADEDIISANPALDIAVFSQLPGHIGQQVVKSEFWRLNPTDSYLCLDSDSIFIRDFLTMEYLTSEGIPYSVITEAHDLQLSAMTRRKNQVINNFKREASLTQKIFKRQGRAYSFGPMPMVWHKAVWKSLEDGYLKPNQMNFIDAIKFAPLESRWYGEALLKFQAITLLPCEPFFKVYHYAWQLDQDRKKGLNNEQLAQLYSGVIYQSSWERHMDWPSEGGKSFSSFARYLKRKMGKI